MHAVSAIGLPSSHLDTVWGWFRALPEKVKNLMDRTDESIDNFHQGFDNDLVYLVFDGGLLGCVILEPRGDKIFEIHLFCPRRTPSDKLAEAIDTFFTAANADDRIEKIICNVQQRQKRLGFCLINNACQYTGWQYREKGELLTVLVWQKALQK